MAQTQVRIIPNGFRRTFLDLPIDEAHRASDAFEKATFADGCHGAWEIAMRKDSPDASKVNLLVYCKQNWEAGRAA